jgi:cytochrome c553
MTITRVGFLLFLCGTVALASGYGGVPKCMSWAYLHTTKGVALPAPPPDAVIRLPGSALELSGAQFNAMADNPDWFPDDHPAMPDVVAKSRPAGGIACADCHLPNGLGHLGTGQMPSYLARQLWDIKTGSRRGDSVAPMRDVVRSMTPGEIVAVAAYLASCDPSAVVATAAVDHSLC